MASELHPLEELLRERIVVLDGAMGTMIQRYKLSEQDYRGKRFRDWKGKDLKGSLELLQLTRPKVIEEIHTAYLEAGADIIETNTFSATTIGPVQSRPLAVPAPKTGRSSTACRRLIVMNEIAQICWHKGLTDPRGWSAGDQEANQRRLYTF